MILNDGFIDSLENLPDECFSIRKGERCKYYDICPFATKDCEGSCGKYDRFTCNTRDLKRMFLRNAKRISETQESKSISGNTFASRS